MGLALERQDPRGFRILSALPIASVVGLVKAVVSLSSAFEAGQDEDAQATFGALVEVVQIQVQVGDSEGRFVPGLTPSDFRLDPIPKTVPG
jgi:hypothetical protein